MTFALCRPIERYVRTTLQPKFTIAAVLPLHAKIDLDTHRLHLLHASRLACKRGCHSCCVDGLTVFDVEADLIRRSHSDLLATGIAHAEGACAFLDEEGACRIYAERPYVCRSQGLPLRWIEESDGNTVEFRDICPLNEEGERIENLPAEDCWTLGPIEEHLACLQLAADAAATPPTVSPRIPLRQLFASYTS